MGGNAPNDNGFVRFNHVRIPAEHMLSKFARVTADGRYVQPPHAKLSYGGVSVLVSHGVVTRLISPQMLYIRASYVRCWFLPCFSFSNDTQYDHERRLVACER